MPQNRVANANNVMIARAILKSHSELTPDFFVKPFEKPLESSSLWISGIMGPFLLLCPLLCRRELDGADMTMKQDDDLSYHIWLATKQESNLASKDGLENPGK